MQYSYDTDFEFIIYTNAFKYKCYGRLITAILTIKRVNIMNEQEREAAA